jgi:hypothetical protein
MNMLIALFAAWLLAGCASLPTVQIAIDPVVQTDAPVQIVRIQPRGDNTLAAVTVKNATDRSIEDFTVVGPFSVR